MNAPVINTKTVIEKIKESSSHNIDTAQSIAQAEKEVGKSINSQEEAAKIKPDSFINTQSNTNKPTPEMIRQGWLKAAKINNAIISDPQKLKVGGKDLELGSTTTIRLTNTTVELDSISTLEQRSALTDQIQSVKNSDSLKKLSNPSTQDEKTQRQEKIKNLAIPNPNTSKVNLVDDDQESLSNLDQNRAELNKRSEEIRLALKNTNLNEEQKAELTKEQESLSESMKLIDTTSKTFATQNGARIEIKNGSNIRSITADQIDSNEELKGYEGFFNNNTDKENQTEIKTPTVKDAYQQFKTQMEKETGKKFALGNNQNLVMYRDGDEAKFLLVESKTDSKTKNRETIVSAPITASRGENGLTSIKAPIKKTGETNKETLSIDGYKFNYTNGGTASANGSNGERVSMKLIDNNTPTISWLDNIEKLKTDGDSNTSHGIPNNASKIDGTLLNSSIYTNSEEVDIYPGSPNRGKRNQTYYYVNLTDAQLKKLLDARAENGSKLGARDRGWLNDGLALDQNRQMQTGARDIIIKNNDGTYILKMHKDTLERLQAKSWSAVQGT